MEGEILNAAIASSASIMVGLAVGFVLLRVQGE